MRVSASVLYVALGAAVAVVLWLLGVSPLDPEDDHGLLERLTELALVVAVFSAGLTIERHVERRSWWSIGLLLLTVVMPLTIAAIALFGIGDGAVVRRRAAARRRAGADGSGPGGGGRADGAGRRGPRRAAPVAAHRGRLQRRSGVAVRGARPLAADEGGTDWLGRWLAVDFLYGAGAGLALGAGAGFAAAALLTRARARGLVAGGWRAS